MPRDFTAITNAINELRAEKVAAFFEEYDNYNSDSSWLAEREHALQITKEEWQEFRAKRNQRFREGGF